MSNFQQEDFNQLIGLVEDSVSSVCAQAFDEGRPVSGEMAWTAIWAYAQAKMLEFEGAFDDC